MKVVIFKEKHAEILYNASSTILLHLVFYHVMRSRYDAGYWYDVHASEVVDRILTIPDTHERCEAAARFMVSRSNHEYEDFEEFEVLEVPVLGSYKYGDAR